MAPRSSKVGQSRCACDCATAGSTTPKGKAKADSTGVDSLLGALEWAEARRSLGQASDADWKTFGLDAPR